MNWSYYHYLAYVAIGAVAVAGIVVALFPRLSAHQDTPRRTPAELVALLAILVLGLACIYTNFYTQTFCFAYLDIGGDTMEQYVPFYLDLLRSIKDGTLGFWNHHYGLGVSFMSYQSMALDPFNLVVVPLCLAFGEQHLGMALAMAQSVKILLAGILFDHLLTYYCHVPLARIVGATLYAFCGWTILWGQHYWLGCVCVTTVALMVALEALMERWTAPRFCAVCLATFVAVVASVYNGFMTMLFAATYALVRVIHKTGLGAPGRLARLYGTLALPVVCGLLLGCVTMVPYARAMLSESSRLGESEQSLTASALSSLQSFSPRAWAVPLLSRLMGNSLITSAETIPESVIPRSQALSVINVYEFPAFGLSCGVIVLALQFAHWTATQAQGRDKALIALTGALVVMYCANAFLPALNNVFATVRYRSTFVVDIVVCLALAVAFEQRAIVAPAQPVLLVAGLAVSLGVVGWSLTRGMNGRLECLAFLALLAVLATAFWLQRRMPNGAVAVTLMVFALVGSSVLDGFFTTNRRTIPLPQDFPYAEQPGRADDTEAALAWVRNQDRTFYRVDKLNYRDWNNSTDSLVQGYSALSSYNSNLDSDLEQFYYQLWPSVLEAGDIVFQTYRYDTEHPDLVTLLGTRYLLASDDNLLIDYDWLEEVAHLGKVRVFRNMREASPLSLWGDVLSESEADALSDAQARCEASLAKGRLIVPDDVAASWRSDGPKSSLGTTTIRPDGRDLAATVDAKASCLAFLALPHTEGWSITVDGQQAQIFRACYGFIGFELTEGHHVVRASYRAPLFGVGLALSVAGALLAIVSCVIGCRRAGAASVEPSDEQTA